MLLNPTNQPTNKYIFIIIVYTYTHIYIYIYIYVCVCVQQKEMTPMQPRKPLSDDSTVWVYSRDKNIITIYRRFPSIILDTTRFC